MREAWLEAPWTVRIALILLVLSVATGAVAGLLTQSMDSDDLVFTVVTWLIGIAIFAGFVSRLLVGRNWARVIVTILVVLGVIASVLDVWARIYAFSTLTLVLNIPNAIAVVLLWLPVSRRHFTRG